MKRGNIVGEPFAKYVNEQIKQRQSFHGSGFGSPRDPKHLVYLNSKTSWIKMASSVSINNTEEDQEAELEAGKSLKDGKARLEEIGLSQVDNFIGQGLARKAVLFNGLSEVKFDEIKGTEEKPVSEFKTEKFSSTNQRAGYSKSNSIWNSEFAYGLGGTEFGIQPMPGISSVEITHLNRGSIRKATVTLKAYNRFQFALIEMLYLRLGYTMLLEWGNSHFIENDIIKNNEGKVTSNPGDLRYTGNTLVEDFWFTDNYPSNRTHLGILNKVEQYRERYDGNYDGFFGKVSNFNWNFNQDASYDITIDLISLGDVVESLKINTLVKPFSVKLEFTQREELNLTSIQNYLYIIRENFDQFKTDPDFYNAKQSIVDDNKVEFLGLEFQNIFGDKGNEKYFYYIRFGRFLDFLQENIISKLKNENTEFPIVSIDTDEDANIMSLYPNQFSLDPRVCLVNSNYFDPLLNSYPSFFNSLKKFFDPDLGIICGKIMNVYLNFDFIGRILESNTDSKGNLSLYTFLQSICNGINKSLGNINQLEPIVDENRNSLIILDQNTLSQKQRNELRKTLNGEEEEESIPLNLYGYNTDDSTSNFVKSFSFRTEIGPDLATIISIGATAQGAVVGEDATAFSNWNSGLKDRFQQESKEPEQPPTPKNAAEAFDQQLDNNLPSSNPKSYPFYIKNGRFNEEEKTKYESLNGGKNSGFYLTTQQRKLRKKLNALFYQRKKTINQEKQQQQNEQNKKKQEVYEFGTGASEFKKYLIRAWGNVFNSGNFDSQPQYLLCKPKFITSGLKLFTNDYFDKIKKSKKPTSSIGFIPVKLQIELDGISGIKIYQSLRINTNFLPGNYPEVLEFLVTKVNHTLQDNQWVTKIETISQPIIEEPENIQEGENITSLTPPGVIFNLPVDPTLPGALNIRNDSGGAGYYGAARGIRIHEGLDLSTFRGQQIFSPIDGIIQLTKATPPSTLTGIKIIGTGIYEGYIAYIQYTRLIGLINTPVLAGDPIGSALDLSPDYPEEVTDHVHFAIKKDGDYINPTYLMYNINGEVRQGVNIFQDL